MIKITIHRTVNYFGIRICMHTVAYWAGAWCRKFGPRNFAKVALPRKHKWRDIANTKIPAFRLQQRWLRRH